MLELDIDDLAALGRVNVVMATKEPVEVTEVKGTLGVVLEIDERVGELLEVEVRIRRVLEELPRLEARPGRVLEGLPRLEAGPGRVLKERSRLEARRGRALEKRSRLEEGPGRVLEELPRVEERLGRVLEELPRLEDGVYSEDNVVDEVLRFIGEPAGSVCNCGDARLGGPLRLTVGTTRDVRLPSNVGRNRTGFGKLGQEAAIIIGKLAVSKNLAELGWSWPCLRPLTVLDF